MIEEEQVIIKVSDRGMGIPASDLPYIFDKFYRGSNVDSDISGSGLGLSIVRTIVETNGGRIWVDSDSSSGSAFTVMFPQAEA